MKAKIAFIPVLCLGLLTSCGKEDADLAARSFFMSCDKIIYKGGRFK